MKNITVTYHLDLVSHIKQYLEKFKCSFFDQVTEDVENAINKHQRGEELTPEELWKVAEHRVYHNFKIAFRNGILSNESIVLPDDKKELIDDLKEMYNKYGEYFIYESYYVMKFLDEAPEIVNRAISLKKIFVNKSPSQRVRDFCKEAYLTHISGHYIASAILMRSIVETILLDKFQIDRCPLWELNDAAKENSIYDYSIWEKIDFIRLEINNILHNIIKEKTTAEKNIDIIKITQDILEYLLNDDFKISKDDQKRVNKSIEKSREERKKKRAKKYYRNP